MFCTNCGNKIKDEEKFCTSCGMPVKKVADEGDARTSFEKRPRDKMKNHDAIPSITEEKREKLEGKVWFRFLKVCYIFVFVAGVLIIGGVSIGAFPSKTINNDLSTINCNNGKVYTLSRNKIFAYGDELDSYGAEHARILCKYDTLDFYNYKYSNEFIPQNYTFKPVYKYPDIGSHIFYSSLSLLGFIVVIKLIKIAVLYIFTGDTQWRKEFRKPY